MSADMTARAFRDALARLGWDARLAAEMISGATKSGYEPDDVEGWLEGRRVPQTVATFVRLRTARPERAPATAMSAEEFRAFLSDHDYTQAQIAVILSERLGRQYRFQDVSKWSRGPESGGRAVPALVALAVRQMQEEARQAARRRTGMAQSRADKQRAAQLAAQTEMPLDQARLVVKTGRKAGAL
jgi:hypothetical protein